MSKDLRNLFKEDNLKGSPKMKAGHEERFLELLEKELPIKQRPSYFLWKVAASMAILLSLGLYFFSRDAKEKVPTTVVDINEGTAKTKSISLGDLSPDLKKVEDYYISTINLELSKLELTNNNKELVDSYLEQLSTLNGEYQNLNAELNEIGPNDQTINALIKNLQLRLQLLQKLKEKLNELKTSENEQDDIV